MNLEIPYKSIINDLHDGLYFVDSKRVITFWNKAAEQISGFKAQEVIGSLCSDNILTHVDCSGNSLCHNSCPLSKTMVSGNPHSDEMSFFRSIHPPEPLIFQEHSPTPFSRAFTHLG